MNLFEDNSDLFYALFIALLVVTGVTMIPFCVERAQAQVNPECSWVVTPKAPIEEIKIDCEPEIEGDWIILPPFCKHTLKIAGYPANVDFVKRCWVLIKRTFEGEAEDHT